MAITRFTVDDNVIDTRMNQMVDEIDSAIGQKANSVNAELTGTARLNGKEIATTEVESIALMNGWQGGLTASRSGKIVTLSFDISGGTIAQGTVIANLPYYFRPSSVKYGHIIGSGGINCTVQIYPDGNCSINYFSSTWTNGQKIGSVFFDI